MSIEEAVKIRLAFGGAPGSGKVHKYTRPKYCRAIDIYRASFLRARIPFIGVLLGRRCSEAGHRFTRFDRPAQSVSHTIFSVDNFAHLKHVAVGGQSGRCTRKRQGNVVP